MERENKSFVQYKAINSSHVVMMVMIIITGVQHHHRSDPC